MGQALKRIRRRREGKTALGEIFAHPEIVLAIHYSCENFNDPPDGASPRITSVAVRNLKSGQTKSFSIHQVAEKNHIPPADINGHYDSLEKKMLRSFYGYVGKHQNCKWLHWNMRDSNYGFDAIAHRFEVLGGKPGVVPEAARYDLARLLIELYGVGYIGHPRLAKIVELNKISDLDFLDGAQEAQAFVDGQYVRLHKSTLRKVDILCNLVERAADGSLKTKARWHEIYGGMFGAATEAITEYPLFALIALISSVLTIVSFFFDVPKLW
jgi:hypothetical protein